MSDLWHFWGEDLAVSPSGDLLLVEPLNANQPSTLYGNDEGTQRIYRRLMTGAALNGSKSGEDIFAPGYGGGVPQLIGTPVTQAQVSGMVNRQMALEAAVAKSPPPVITLTAQPGIGAFFVEINYTNAATGQPVSLSFDPTSSRNG